MSRRTDLPLALALLALLGSLLFVSEARRAQALRLGEKERACERDQSRCLEYFAARDAAKDPRALIAVGVSLVRGWWED